MLAALCLLNAGSVHSASGLATVSDGGIEFSIDTAVFLQSGSGSPMLELYVSIPVGQLARTDGDLATFQTDAVLTSPEGDTLEVQQWISEVEWSEDRSVVNATVMAVPPGSTDISVTISDLGNGRRGTASRTVDAAPGSRISELEIANAVMPSLEDSQNPLRKGEWVVFPAADGRFDLPGEGTAYIYFEVYGAAGTVISRQSRLTDAGGAYLFARPWDALEIPEGAGAVGFLDSIDLGAARSSGLHFIETAVIAGGDTITESKPVMIARTSGETEPPPQAGADGSDPSGYMSQFSLILSGSERTVLEGLTGDEARDRFYLQYWAALPAGEREDFEARCDESEVYATIFREGWQTDRGRVFILFGRPDEVERAPIQVDILPYETWSYFGQGTETFVFVDRDGSGNYEQVYSTVPGEVSYSNWRSMLNPVGADTTDDEFEY